MTTIKLNVLFKKMQKDDKKEVLMFHVLSDELPHADELLKMPGTIALLTVEDSDIESLGAEFVSIQRDNKKTVLKFNVKSDAKETVGKLYPFAGSNINLTLQQSQLSIDEFFEGVDEGIEYSIEQDGSIYVDPNQLEIDEVDAFEFEPEEEPEQETKLQRIK